ncbi:MAG: esterase-like activity of phytase family protein [Bacteriovoracaceae bacterium]
MKLLILFCILLPLSLLAEPKFKGIQVFHHDYKFKDTLLGGLSGITYDEKSESFFAISDDPGKRGKSRIYEFSYSENNLFHLVPKNVIFLNEDFDGEGIARTNKGDFIISSETLLPTTQYLKIFSDSGNKIDELAVDKKFIPAWLPWTRGVSPNKSFESMAITQDNQFIFTANEISLYQDKDNLVRIVRFKSNGAKFLEEKEFAYQLDNKPDNGIVDIIATNQDQIITLERSYDDKTNKISSRLFEVDLKEQINYQTSDSINLKNSIPVKKKLLLDLDTILPYFNNVPHHIDNIEGMTLAKLKNGQSILVLISDNNFSEKQITQFIFLDY